MFSQGNPENETFTINLRSNLTCCKSPAEKHFQSAPWIVLTKAGSNAAEVAALAMLRQWGGVQRRD